MQATVNVETIKPRTIFPLIHQVEILSHLTEEDLDCLGDVQLVRAAAGSQLYREGEKTDRALWILLEGEVRASKPEPEGGFTYLMTLESGEVFGEVPLLTGVIKSGVSVDIVRDSVMVRIEEAGFWRMMSTCPEFRNVILSRVMQRIQLYQAMTTRREKLISLGTLAAGLMHELNNPGSAARRASAQLRENMIRLQQISLRFSRASLSEEQLDCMRALQQEALNFQKPEAKSTLEQADAEEALACWLEEKGVANAWKLAPTLTAVGWTEGDIECARSAFPPEILSDALNWLDALISSVQLVGTIEESITRVTELVTAVKRYSYDDKGTEHQVNVHDGIQSTLTILGHKLRHKSLTVDKRFAADIPTITTCGTGLNQVWTNLLDNAIDASPEGGRIVVRTWTEQDYVCVAVADNGPGIAPEHYAKIFQPFFTTKPVGVGTGLGLDIAHRIVVGHYGGSINFDSADGTTEFVVRLPIKK
jgi:signal transduction histidine kinase